MTLSPMEQTVLDAVRRSVEKGKPYSPSTRLYAEICDKLAEAGALRRPVKGQPHYVLAQASLPGVA